MIISASYKTDIPAFYGEWFLRRVDAGFAQTVNPYSRRIQRVPLTRDSVDGFVFWTRNVAPFLGVLEEMRSRGFPFVVQYTITAYPRALDRATIAPEQAIHHLHLLNRTFGPAVAVWRYDPVIVTSLTPPNWHVDTFARLSRAIAGAASEVVLSFAQIYRKTARNLDAAARKNGFQWTDLGTQEKVLLLSRLAAVAVECKIRPTLCGQPELLAAESETGSAIGLGEARCIDAKRLQRAAGEAGQPIAAACKPHRPRCGCFSSRDIGDYDTCPHGCVYCYAVSSQPNAKDRLARHDPYGDQLLASSWISSQPRGDYRFSS